MGYRTYIGVIPKREYNKIKSLTPDDLYNHYGVNINDDYLGPYKLGKQLYEFGKYTDFDPPKKSYKKFFKRKETQDRYLDSELIVVSKEFLEYIIQNYTDKVKKYYKDMLSPFFDNDGKRCSDFLNSVKTEHNYPSNTHTWDFTKITIQEQTALFNIFEHMRSFSSEWGVNNSWIEAPYNLNEGDEITTSWKYEYGIFELVRIYKSFDWKKNIMYYYGY